MTGLAKKEKTEARQPSADVGASKGDKVIAFHLSYAITQEQYKKIKVAN